MAVSSRKPAGQARARQRGRGRAAWGAASARAGGQTQPRTADSGGRQRAVSPASRRSSHSAGPPSYRESPQGTKSVPSPTGHDTTNLESPKGPSAGQGAGYASGPAHGGVPSTSRSSGSPAGTSVGRQRPHPAALRHHCVPASRPCAAPAPGGTGQRGRTRQPSAPCPRPAAPARPRPAPDGASESSSGFTQYSVKNDTSEEKEA